MTNFWTDSSSNWLEMFVNNSNTTRLLTSSSSNNKIWSLSLSSLARLVKEKLELELVKKEIDSTQFGSFTTLLSLIKHQTYKLNADDCGAYFLQRQILQLTQWYVLL